MITIQGKRSDKRKTDEKLTARTFVEPFIYLLPFIIVVSVFMLYPIITVFLNSFLEEYNYLANTYSGFGLGNYYDLFSDKEFTGALQNTFIYVGCVVPVSTVLSLCIAIMLNKRLKGTSLFQFA